MDKRWLIGCTNIDVAINFMNVSKCDSRQRFFKIQISWVFKIEVLNCDQKGLCHTHLVKSSFYKKKLLLIKNEHISRAQIVRPIDLRTLQNLLLCLYLGKNYTTGCFSKKSFSAKAKFKENWITFSKDHFSTVVDSRLFEILSKSMSGKWAKNPILLAYNQWTFRDTICIQNCLGGRN